MDDPAPTPETIARYAAELRRHVLRRLGLAGVASFDADDIAQDAATRFLADPAAVMGAYPEPHIYAGASAGSRAEDWRRRERAQRTEGARLVVGAAGERCIARPVGTLSTMLSNEMPTELGGYEKVDMVIEFHAALDCLEACDRELVLLVEFCDRSVTEAASIVGLSRAHASRRHTRALALLARFLQEPLAC